MSRYFSRPKVNGNSRKPRADWLDEDYPLIPEITVCEHDAIDTGLVDELGDPIMRAPNPIGFGRDGEW